MLRGHIRQVCIAREESMDWGVERDKINLVESSRKKALGWTLDYFNFTELQAIISLIRKDMITFNQSTGPIF